MRIIRRCLTECPGNGTSACRAVVEESVSAHKGHIFSRLEQLAQAGGICISQPVYDQIRKIVEIPFEDIGKRRLKNIAEPVHVYRIRPAPLPRLSSFLSRVWRSPRLGAVAGVVGLLLALGASFYLRQPAVLWDTVSGGRGMFREHAAIAVLPFDDMSPTHDQQYLADGITEELIMGLAKFPELVVMARNSTFALQGEAYGRATSGKGSQCSLSSRAAYSVPIRTCASRRS